MPQFHPHTADTAPTRARPILEKMLADTGRVPDAVGRLAESPEALRGFLTGNEIFTSSTLDVIDREVVVMTVATRNACHLCVAMHTGILHRAKADPELIAALRDQTALPDPGREALRRFTIAVMRTRGAVPDAEFDEFTAAGYTPRQALDVVLGVGVYTISTYANRLVGAQVDPPLRRFAWEGEPV